MSSHINAADDFHHAQPSERMSYIVTLSEKLRDLGQDSEGFCFSFENQGRPEDPSLLLSYGHFTGASNNITDEDFLNLRDKMEDMNKDNIDLEKLSEARKNLVESRRMSYYKAKEKYCAIRIEQRSFKRATPQASFGHWMSGYQVSLDYRLHPTDPVARVGRDLLCGEKDITRVRRIIYDFIRDYCKPSKEHQQKIDEIFSEYGINVNRDARQGVARWLLGP